MRDARSDLEVVFKNTHDFWVNVVRGPQGRVFLPCEDRRFPGEDLLICFQASSAGFPVRVPGRIVGIRPPSPRFRPGLFVNIAGDDIRTCASAVGLDPRLFDSAHRRRFTRIPCSFPGELKGDGIKEQITILEMSKSGARVSLPIELHAGERMTLTVIHDSEKKIDLPSRVVRYEPDGFAAFEFENVGREQDDELSNLLLRIDRLADTTRLNRIFIGDPDARSREAIKAALSALPCEVAEFVDGVSLLSAVHMLRPRLVLMDALMPKIDAVNIAQIVRCDLNLARSLLVLMADSSEEALIQIAAREGMDDVLTKPINPLRAFDVVRACLG